MIELLIFDLDGVLVDCKQMHFEALNKALGEYAISEQEHLSTYDGLNTKAKLKLLTEKKGLPEELHGEIFLKKQIETLEKIKDIKENKELQVTFERLKKEGFILCVASNSIYNTIRDMLVRLGLEKLIDFFLSNEQVEYPKPHPEMYMRAMIRAGFSPKETLILEDSHIGRKGAYESGAFVMPVKDTSDVTYENIMKYCNQEIKPVKWDAGPLNILIPAAGLGSRFSGYTFPKPLIEINREPMLKVVVDNLNIKGQFIFIVRTEHQKKYNIDSLLSLISPGCYILSTGAVTEGAACTTLLAKDFINNDTPLLIANSDQFLEWDSAEFMYSMNCDGGIVTFRSTHPKWSFVKVSNGFVTEVAEKNPISDIATAGIYWWRKGSDYVKYAEQMISKQIKTNGEYYVAPVFSEAIADGKKIKTFDIKGFYGLGTPEDLQTFLNK